MSGQFHRLAPGFQVFGNSAGLQELFDAAVVIPTIGRPEVARAVRSVFDQRGVGRIQLLIGVDKPASDLWELIDLISVPPAHVVPVLFYPGYSTSVRHGGLHPARDGGVLRATLTLLANSRFVAYLDDDNWWAETHVSSLLTAIVGKHWAFALRRFVHPESARPVCVDDWESVGPGAGIFKEKFGGFVDPNCLMIDKLACWQCVQMWNIPLTGDPKAMSADRNVFACLLRHGQPGRTGEASAYYVLDPGDGLHPLRLRRMGERYAAAAER